MARRLLVPHTTVWRTLHAEGMYPYHVQRVQHLGPGDFVERLEFCKWLNGSRELLHYILFTRLTPNDPYMGHTAPPTYKRCILYIYSTNIGTECFKHDLYSPFFLFKMQFVS